MLKLTNKTAVITGAGSGIGKETALLFARQGAMVYALDLNIDAAESTANDILLKSGNAIPVKCNVSVQQEVNSVFCKIEKIDILINSAGISHVGNLEDTTEEDLDRLYSVNVKGVYNCLKAALPSMKANRRGVIINMTSIANHIGLVDRFAYSMSKGAVYAMTLSVARDYISYGIRCNSVSPARVHTPFVDGFIHKNYPGKEEEMFQRLSSAQPIGRMAKPSEIAGVILYMSSDEASFITGTDYAIDGGVIHLNT